MWVKDQIEFLKTYDEKTALICANLDRKVYQYDRGNYNVEGMTYRIQQNAKGGVKFLLSKSGKTVYIAFKGTSSLKNIYANVNIRMKNVSNNVYIHSGFLDYYKQAEKQVEEYLNETKPKRIVLSGHSMGGAVATIAAYMLYKSYGPIIELFTFGSPQVGNMSFKKYMNAHIKKSWRFVNNKDYVVRSVPRRDFHHVGNLVLINNDNGNYITSHLMPEYIKGIKSGKYDILRHSMCRTKR